MAAGADGALSPVTGIALVGLLGVGAQWLAWRLRMPAIVLMLVAGLVVGPVLGVFDPARDIGPLMQPFVAIAVAIILFEGGLTLNFESLRDAAKGVRRLVLIGAPLGWLLSALTLHYGAGLGWETSAVFGGIMIVTGPTVIAPLLRQARLARRPAALLQWEAIVNDPIGALAAVLAFQIVVLVEATGAPGQALGPALGHVAFGTTVAGAGGAAAGWTVARAFRRALVPEYMKVPVLFAAVLVTFAATDAVLHESGLLAVTVMGLVIANAGLPSFTELYRFKEHATILLVSGVFVLLAAGLDPEALARLDWRAAVFIAAVVLLARPVTVLTALLGTDLPWRERLLIALTGPRGVVLVAVAGLFGERLVALGVADGAALVPLAFALVGVTVILHGFTLIPLARLLGQTSARIPGVILVGGGQFTAALGRALDAEEVPVLVTDPNDQHLRDAREAGLPVFYGDILSEAAEHKVELVQYGAVIAASDNDAYNTLVATDLAPEFGREHVFQLKRARTESQRHSLPPTLGGSLLGGGETLADLDARVRKGEVVRRTGLSEAFTLEDWREKQPDATALAEITPAGQLRLLGPDAEPRGGDGARLFALGPENGKPEPPAS
ncbi:sodium:proton exchanger [Maritimibacter sp. 55A14]|uniref:cation:proton antiporter n=1 Tax=Maritimibacter sp. 55A14 TaxID=2174844 RepID=UPI000D615D44|nr:sodium:proton antiporter [Maritimibacter sp. 55A14]PWE33978.1 sodium:proton exchanger [Maritimibacter sp. 55A14]